MKSGRTLAPFEASNDIAGLIETLLATEQRLEELTAGEIDSVAGRDGRTFLLRRAQDQLRLREASKQAAILNALPANVALLDPQGRIISVNEAWRRFWKTNAVHSPGCGVGLNYLEVCDRAKGENAAEAHGVATGIRAVLAGNEKSFSLEYPCHSPTEQRWFLLSVSPLADEHQNGAVVMHVNITERKQGEMASARLAAVIESSQDAIISKNLHGIVTSWNGGAEKLFGYTAAEMVGTSIRRLNPADRLGEHQDILEKIRRGEKCDHFEAVRQTKDGGLIDISVTASPIRDDTGTVVGVSIVARDITERRRVEEALRISQANMAAAQCIAHFGSWELELTNTDDLDANPLRWSDEMFRIAGFEPGAVEVSNEFFFRLVPEDEHAAIREAVAAAIREGRQCSVVHRLIRPDGKECVVQEIAQVFVDEQSGKPLKIVGTAHDITERKRADVALQSSEARYRTMLQGIEAGVIVHGADLRIVAFNPKATELLGVDDAQLRARVATDAPWGRLRPDGSAFLPAELPYRRAHATRQPVRDVVMGVKRPMTRDFVWLLVNANPVLTPLGDVAEVIVTLMDVTSRIDAERALQRQQSELRVLFDLMPAMICFKDTENRMLRVNSCLAEAIGKPVGEIEGKSCVEIYPQEAAKFFADDLAVIRSGSSKLGMVETLRDPAGREIWVQTDKVPVCDKDGKVIGIVVMALDITESKRAEEALRASEQHLQLAAQAGGVGTFAHDLRTGGMYCSPLLRTMLCLNGAEEFSFEFLVERVVPDDRPGFLAAMTRGRDPAGEGRIDTEYRLTLPDRSVRWLHVQAQTWFEGGGTQRHAVKVVGVAQDSTERKRTEQALRESEEHFRFLNDLTEATRPLVDPERIMAVTARMLGQHLRVSRCAYADVETDGEQFTIRHDYTDGCASTVGKYRLSLFGARAVAELHRGQTLIVRNVAAELLPEDGAEMFKAIGIGAIISCPLLKEGRLRALMAVHQTSPRKWSASEVDLVQEVVGRCWSTIERRTAEENLRTSEKRFKALFDQAAVGVALVDARTGRFVLVNQRFSQITGRAREDLEQLTFAAITHPEDVVHDRDRMRQLNEGIIRECSWEKRYLRADRSEVWVNVTVSAMWAPAEPPDLCIAVVQEITERKMLEEQLRQTQKMEAIGTLAGGIAHDFNNILGAINGYTELARLTLKGNPVVRDHLGAVLQASTRATDLVRQILAFSRQERLERVPLQLRPIIIETLKLLRATLPSTIEFETSLAVDAPVVLADATQIHQVLMNLGTNASHAMKDLPGKLQVKLERCVVDATTAATQSRLHPGVYARVSVADTGSGMDAATRARIFEPFFTTKAPGAGTGLGLSVVHGIIASHDGAVTVCSELGEGTIFDLYFPAHAGEAVLVTQEGETVPVGRGERILLVDDEELLIRLGEKTLTALGYVVEVASQPAVALEWVRADPQRFALVLTDQTMPGMTGLDLAGELRKIRPGLPIILMTGYSGALTAARMEALGISQLLLKPMRLRSLATAIQAALNAIPKI